MSDTSKLGKPVLSDSPEKQETTSIQELTRREWLLRLGGTAFLYGFSGAVDAEAATHVAVSQADQESAAAALPPGLFNPSSDHMTRALTNDARYISIPPGSETDFAVPSSGPFVSQFFSGEEFKTVGRLVELLLGEAGSQNVASLPVADEIAEWIDLTSANAAAVRAAAAKLSPQHRALAVAYYGAETVRHLETEEPDKTWRKGLKWLSEESQRQYGKAFLELATAEQLEVLTNMSTAGANDHPGTRLFQLLKSQTIHGFYTSQRGLKELDFKGNTFYAECPGCIGSSPK